MAGSRDYNQYFDSREGFRVPNHDQNNQDQEQEALQNTRKERARSRELSMTQELMIISHAPDATPEERALAQQLQEMREKAKDIGAPLEILDQFAKDELAEPMDKTIKPGEAE
jgi:hypothetical protein